MAPVCPPLSDEAKQKEQNREKSQRNGRCVVVGSSTTATCRTAENTSFSGVITKVRRGPLPLVKLLIRANESMRSDWLLDGKFREIKLRPNPVKPISIRKAETPGSRGRKVLR